MVFLLEYFPMHIELLGTISFTPKAYIGYLEFFQSNQQAQIPKHSLEQHLIKFCTFKDFLRIIELRLTLGLDNELTIARNVRNLEN